MVCKNCGKEVDTNTLVCGYCGHSLSPDQISEEKKQEVRANMHSDESLKPNRAASVRAFGIFLMIVSGITDVISIFMIGSSSVDAFSTILAIGSVTFFAGLVLTFAFR